MSAALFGRAIRRVGESIRLVRDGAEQAFDGCVQHRRFEDASGPAGYGESHRAVLYAAASGVSKSLRPGDLLRARSGDYRLVAVEEITLGGETVYLRGEVARILR